MLVKVFIPNKIAHGVLSKSVFHPMSIGILQCLYDCMIIIVAVFCNRTNPPPNGILRTMALLRMIIATDTVVDIMQAAATATDFFCSTPPSISSVSVFSSSMSILTSSPVVVVIFVFGISDHDALCALLWYSWFNLSLSLVTHNSQINFNTLLIRRSKSISSFQITLSVGAFWTVTWPFV